VEELMVPDDDVQLVRAADEHAALLAEMSRRAFHTDVTCGAPSEVGPPGYDSAEAHLRFMRTSDCLEIVCANDIVGAVMILSHGAGHYEYCGLFVDPARHNRGIAARALELTWRRYPDAARWTAETPAWNTRTAHFYEKLGFRRITPVGAADVVYEKTMPRGRC
jgi:GNAT superfamily N-acetyltransferase